MTDANGWHPVGSAPRDGTVVIVSSKYNGIGTAKFLKRTRNGSEWVMTYDEGRSVVDVRDEYETYTGVTHWMPLPQPPDNQPGEG